MTNTHRHRRAVDTRVRPALAGALLLAGSLMPVVPAHADSPGSRHQQYTSGVFIVKLSDAPVAAAYEAGLSGPRPRPTTQAPGEQLDAHSAAAKKYLRHLESRRADVLDAFPGVTPLYD